MKVAGTSGQDNLIPGSWSLVILTTISSVPEPSSLVLIVCGLAAVAARTGFGFRRPRRPSAGL